MSKIKAPKRITPQSGSSRPDVSTSWYTPLLVLYHGNRRILTGGAIGVLLIIAGILGYNYIQGERDAQAQEFLGAILLEYEKGDYRISLDGIGENIGLLKIVERYGSTAAGNTARFYAGNAFFALKEYDQALEQFEQFRAGRDFLGASATAGRAAIHELHEEYSLAGDLFRRAADMDANAVRGPYYLRKSAHAYISSREIDLALDVIRQAKENYPEMDLMDEFDYLRGRALVRQ